MSELPSTSLEYRAGAASAQPVRILHVVGGMERGGIETWLMHVLRRVDRTRFRMDFVSHTPRLCAFDPEIRELGSNVISGPDPHRPWRYASEFRRILAEHGPYDVIHCHVHHFSGYVLKLAAAAGVRHRFIHSHNDTKERDRSATLPRKLYMGLMCRWIDRYATRRIGVSGCAGSALFGEAWRSDPRSLMMFYSIDLQAFRTPLEYGAVRKELGIPAGAFVVGHAGRFVPQKNHSFLLRIFAEAARRDSSAFLLMLGTGPLKPAIEREAHELGIAHRTLFAGVRGDVPLIMRAAMDLFLLPSLHEGLPVVMLEAQAAGLPCVISEAIAPETDVVKPLVERLALRGGPAKWADAIMRIRSSRPAVSTSQALEAMTCTRFNLNHAVKELEDLYCG